ncbi:uncharacterized protein N7518_002999 [Penicillium psychrosexuale]|uniref:uncharacterized protein n=1 Tax=Penicillium psychrosexuale TaxID=1002107 RepID=UPI0025453127|nr:uncharacterized protein N7518_002999 [Penicillium psychrosexuale]KAJ5800931.1 hypothetical protein N7518_002999 [Penicillium psychrosexuale]
MAEQLAQLVCEVERLVTAPYVPSLQDLYDLVQHTKSSTIGTWALCKPCQVGLLADVLIEALSRSLVALPLITAFASTSSAFRDALLERHPVILDAFLEKAVDTNGDEYLPACIALFSSPLPASLVPPARVAPFIRKLVSLMAANPCVKTVAPLHTLISGLKGSPRILNDIPSEVMSNLQLEFTKTLRNLDDHMGNLLCLATFAQIATALDTTSQTQHGSEMPWLLSIKHFFGQKRGLKTLDLVVLRVILACSSSCNLAPSEAAESIRLAICIADAIEPEQKQAWMAGNNPKIAKLCEKAVKDVPYSQTQTMVIVFLHTLLPAHSLPSQLREVGIKVLLSKNSQQTIETVPHQLIPRLAKSLAESGEHATRQLLAFTFDVLKGSKCTGAEIITLHLAHLVLAGVQEVHADIMLSNVKHSMVPMREVLGEMVEYFPRQPSESQCSGRAWRTSELYTKQNRLFLSLLGLYNVASAQCGSDIIVQTFIRRVEQSMPSLDCAFSTTTPKAFRGSFALRDRHELPSTQVNRNWRSGVTELFMQNAQTSHDNMMRKIEDTCFDLERRCHDVEGPLRAAEEERDRYARENEQLKRQNEELNEQLKSETTEMETKLRNSHDCFVELGHENTRLEQLLQGQYAYTEELNMSLNSAREELQYQQQSSEKALHFEKEKARSKELEMMATITGKDDQLEDLQQELCSLQMKNEETRQSLDQISSEKATLSEISSSLEQELASAREALKQARLLADEKEDQVNRFMAQEEELRKKLGSAETTVAQQNLEVERLYSELEESDEKSRSEIEKLKHDLEAGASRATSDIAKHETENRRLHAAMQAAALDASRDVQSKDKRIQHLERKVQALRDERAAKAREFSEAQQHIGRLMGVMGFSANAPESNTPAKHQRTRSSVNATPAARIPQTISDDEDGIQLAQSFESITSSFNGPTPKRPRGNRKSTNQPYALNTTGSKAKSPPPASGMSRSVRKPLAEADRNSPTKSHSSSGSKRNQVDDSFQETQAQGNSEENRFHDLDLDMDLEFSKDFLFSSTAFTESTDRIAP